MVNLRFRPQPPSPPSAPPPPARPQPVDPPAPAPQDLGIPPEAEALRDGAAQSLEAINVLTDTLMAAGTDAAWGDPRPRFEVVAWVRNLDDHREVWVDLYVDGAGEPHRQLLVLDYFAPAGGGGDLFRLNLAFPPEHPDTARHGVVGVAYRLYGRIGDALYTDGVLHQHRIAGPEGQ
ncbi:MAG: hypothetical protein ACRDJU_07025 [Actinomycetota bacterium]